MKTVKKIFIGGLSLFVLLFFIIVGTHRWVHTSTTDNIYTSTDSIPFNKVGVLLGTSKHRRGGDENLYYKYRIQAAVTLYQSGKIAFILVSGDNGSKYYDEPSTIKRDLIAKGIPKDKIYLDYAGFRTLDSMIRSKEVFGQQSITVISQPFHNERALFIAHFNDIKAIGFNAQDVSRKYGLKVQVRERFARVKMLLDILFGKQPKFLGEPIEIE